MYCPYCGSRTEQDMSFCPSCGKEIKSFYMKETNKTDGIEEFDNTVKNVSPSQTNNEPTVNIVNNDDQHKKKFRNCTLMEAISSILAMVAMFLLVFLPLFINQYTEKVGEEWVEQEEKYSMFRLCYETIKVLVSGEFSDSYFLFFGVFRLLIAVWSVTLIYISVKDVVKKVTYLVKFDEYYQSELSKDANREEAQEIIRQLKKNGRDNLYYYVFSEVLFMFVIGGYDKLFIAGCLIVGLMMMAGFLLGYFAKGRKNRLKKEIKAN